MKFDFSIVLIGCWMVAVNSGTDLEDLKSCTEDCIDVNCSSTLIINRNIACRVYEYANGSFSASVQEGKETADANVFTPSKRVRGATMTIECGKVFKGYHKRIKKTGEQCMRELCKAPVNDKARVERDRYFPYRVENFKCTTNKMNLSFPYILKPGMAVEVSGQRNPVLTYCLLSFFMDPKRKTNVLTWLNIHVHWKRKDVWVAEGFSKTFYAGFPISDPSNFTLELELTPTSTKIYADKTLITTKKLITGIDECYIHGFKSIHQLLVHKTDE